MAGVIVLHHGQHLPNSQIAGQFLMEWVAKIHVYNMFSSKRYARRIG